VKQEENLVSGCKKNTEQKWSHAVQENHVINWVDASVIDSEPDKLRDPPHPQGRTTSHGPWGGQLPTQSCVCVFLAHLLLTVPIKNQL